VLFVSTHQSGAYPGTGRMSEVGKGEGEGATINLPLPGTPLRSSHMLLPGCRTAWDPGTQLSSRLSILTRLFANTPCNHLLVLNTRTHGRAGDSGGAAMSAAFEEVVAPAAERFRPDIILVRNLLCSWATQMGTSPPSVMNLCSAEPTAMMTRCRGRYQQAMMHTGGIPWQGCS